MMPPETCAMPEVMMVINSERVAPPRKGRMVSGASVWPIKMLAATLVDSAPLVPIVRCMTQATTDDLLHDAQVVEHGKERRDEDDGGKHGEGKDRERIFGVAEHRAEDHGGAVSGVAEQSGDGIGADFEDLLAVGPADNEEREHKLEGETPGHRAPAD